MSISLLSAARLSSHLYRYSFSFLYLISALLLSLPLGLRFSHPREYTETKKKGGRYVAKRTHCTYTMRMIGQYAVEQIIREYTAAYEEEEDEGLIMRQEAYYEEEEVDRYRELSR